MAADQGRPDVRFLAVRRVEAPGGRGRRFAVTAPYVEQFWLAHLGPTAMCLSRWLWYCELPVDSDAYTPIDVEVARFSLGVGRTGMGGRQGPFVKAIERLDRFGFLTVDERRDRYPVAVALRTHIGLVPVRLRAGWPAELQRRHDTVVAAITATDPREES